MAVKARRLAGESGAGGVVPFAARSVRGGRDVAGAAFVAGAGGAPDREDQCHQDGREYNGADEQEDAPQAHEMGGLRAERVERVVHTRIHRTSMDCSAFESPFWIAGCGERKFSGLPG